MVALKNQNAPHDSRPLFEMKYWDAQEVGCWLLSNGGFFVELVQKFHHNTIDGALLLKLKEKVLMDEYGLSFYEAAIFLDRLANDKSVVKEEVNHIAKVDLERCDSKEEGVPSIVHEWSYEEVCLWLLSTGGEKLKLMNKFYSNQVNGTQLLSIAADDLTAWGYPASDVKCFLWWRDYIAQNGYCFKDSFNKLFTRPRNKISSDEPISDMDSVIDGSDAVLYNHFIVDLPMCDSDFYADEPFASDFNVKRKNTDGVDIVIGDNAKVATPHGVDIVLGGIEVKQTIGEDIVLSPVTDNDLETEGQPDIILSPVTNDDLERAIDIPRTSGKPTDGEIIHIGPAPSRYDAYAEQNLKAIREATENDELETAGNQTADVVIQINPAPSQYDLHAEQNFKDLRGTCREQTEPGSLQSIAPNDQKQPIYQIDEVNHVQLADFPSQSQQQFTGSHIRIRHPHESKKQLQIHLDPNIQNAFTQLFQNESQQLFQIHRIVPAQFPLSIFRLLKGKDQEQPQEQIQNNTALRVIREKSQDESQTQTPSLQSLEIQTAQMIQPENREKYQLLRDSQILDREKQVVQSIQPLKKDIQKLQNIEMQVKSDQKTPFEFDRSQCHFRPIKLSLKTNDFIHEKQAQDHDPQIFQQIQTVPNSSRQVQFLFSQEVVAQVYLQSVLLMEQNYKKVQNQIEVTVGVLIFIAYAAATSDHKKSFSSPEGFGCGEMILVA